MKRINETGKNKMHVLETFCSRVLSMHKRERKEQNDPFNKRFIGSPRSHTSPV